MKLFLRRIDALVLSLFIPCTCYAKLGAPEVRTVEKNLLEVNDGAHRELQSGRIGEWSELYNMRVLPIHSMLLPDGCVLGYGTNAKGNQRADLYYEVWDVSKGIHEEARMLMEHQTKSDMFCSTLNMDISTGNIIVFGGDLRDDGKNLGSKNVLELDYQTHEITHHSVGEMNYGRWYATSINLPNGDILLVGGKGLKDKYISMPELWSAEDGFRVLTNAEIPAIAKSNDLHWWYPHVYVNSAGVIFIIMPHNRNADIYHVQVEGKGEIEKIGETPFKTDVLDPSIMYRPDEILFLESKGQLWTLDISSNPLVFRKKASIGRPRTNGSFAVLPDGRVVITGGNRDSGNQGNNLGGAIYSVQVWDPETDTVYTGEDQIKARLYHSTSLVLPDGSVVSAGGGAPGPQTNLNGQIYYPDYLFNYNNNEVARPKITECPSNISNDKYFIIHVGSTSEVNRITASKSGAQTHSRNCDARWLELDFEIIDGIRIKVAPRNKNIMVPGLWMINTIDNNGTPSHACLFGVGTAELKI